MNAPELEYLTTAQVAAKLQVNPRTVTRWRNKEGMPHVEIGGTIRFNWELVEGWLAEKPLVKDIDAEIASAEQGASE